MKKILVIALIVVCNKLTAQTPDFNAIQKNVNDSSSQFFYNKLSYQFRLDPSLLDSIGVQHLYFGKVFIKSSPRLFDEDYMTAKEQQSKRNFKKAIAAAEKMIQKDPVNLEMLGVLIQALQKEDPKSKHLPLYQFQAKRIIDCFISSGYGKSEATSYYVSAVSDAYVLMDILGKNPYQFRRTSHSVPLGMMDVYKKGDETIYITVLYKLKD